MRLLLGTVSQEVLIQLAEHQSHSIGGSKALEDVGSEQNAVQVEKQVHYKEVLVVLHYGHHEVRSRQAVQHKPETVACRVGLWDENAEGYWDQG